MIHTLIRDAKNYPLIICITCGLLLSIGLLLENLIIELEPCPLCLVQRFWFVACAAIAYISLLHNPRYGIYPLLTLIASASGAAYAIWHLLLQFDLTQAASCSPPLAYLIESPDLLFDNLYGAFVGEIGCNTRHWAIPIPAWALIGFVFIMLASLVQLRVAVQKIQ